MVSSGVGNIVGSAVTGEEVGTEVGSGVGVEVGSEEGRGVSGTSLEVGPMDGDDDVSWLVGNSEGMLVGYEVFAKKLELEVAS